VISGTEETIFSGVLPSGDTIIDDHSRTVTVDDLDPMRNKVTLTCSPADFPNVFEESASHSVDLIDPSFTVAKTCDAEPISYLGPASFTVTIANTGDVPLDIDASDGIGPFQLAAGASQNFTVIEEGPFPPGGTADNVVTATWTLPELYDLPNEGYGEAFASCAVLQPEFETAFALGVDATCFTDLGAGNWGWVNGNGTTSIVPGTYVWPVYAGAGQCDITGLDPVGTVEVTYDGEDVSVEFNLYPPNILGDTHVYAGLTQVPSGGFSPGQWTIEGPFEGEEIFIIVHAVVGIPQ
jgi:hypothetical protein